MAKILCDYCTFGTKEKLCSRGGIEKCQGELFVYKNNTQNNRKTKCRNCGEMVEMISTGEMCPNCYC